MVLPPCLNQSTDQAPQGVLFRFRQIVSLTFAKSGQEVERHMLVMGVVDDAHTATFPHTFPCPAKFSDPASALHDDTSFGMGSKILNDGSTRLFREQAFRWITFF
jgi:hypothetical protein